MTEDPGYPEGDTGGRVSPEKKGLGAGPPGLEELCGLHLRCSPRCIAGFRTGHPWALFPVFSE